MKLTWFGHSAFRVATGQSVILIDPFITHNPVATVKAEAAGRGATHVVLTHGHEDHVGDAEVDLQSQRCAARLRCTRSANSWAATASKRCEGANPGGTIYTDDFDVTFVRADHSSSYGGVYLGNPCGLVVRTREGQTSTTWAIPAIFGDMALINEIHRPDDRHRADRRPLHHEPANGGIGLPQFFKFETIIPCHYKTFPAARTSPDSFIEALAATGRRCKAHGGRRDSAF